MRYGRQEFAREGWDAVVDINLNSVMDAARAFHRALAQSKGAIIIVSSVAAFRSARAHACLRRLESGRGEPDQTLGEAWARDGIRVNGIAPGLEPTQL